jgi:hypothetical protein
MPAITTIRLRRGTAAQWNAANPVLAAGEVGVETNTRKFKFGNGTSAWTALDYAVGSVAVEGITIAWEDITGKPETFAPSAHTHSIDDITDYEAPAGTIVSETAPTGVDPGTIWYDSTSGTAYIFYDDFWVQLAPAVPGPVGPQGTAGEEGPQGPAGDAAFHPFLIGI